MVMDGNLSLSLSLCLCVNSNFCSLSPQKPATCAPQVNKPDKTLLRLHKTSPCLPLRIQLHVKP